MARLRQPSTAAIKWLLAIPGLLMTALALLGGAWFGLDLSFDLPVELLVPSMLATYFGIQALSAAFERHSGSFRSAGQMLEGVIDRLGLNPGWALVLAWTSAIGEELFFRGLLMFLAMRFMPVPWAILLQAVLFAALHPAPRHAWAYPVWTLLVGVICGVVVQHTGSLMPVILAHFVFNLENFNALLGRAASPSH